MARTVVAYSNLVPNGTIADTALTAVATNAGVGNGHVLPAVVGGQWAIDLDVSAPESPYLAFIVGLHVATALALLVYFRRDWVRIIGGFGSSIRERRVETADQRLAWMIVLATIPVPR